MKSESSVFAPGYQQLACLGLTAPHVIAVASFPQASDRVRKKALT
jgi:hypothetical protein